MPGLQASDYEKSHVYAITIANVQPYDANGEAFDGDDEPNEDSDKIADGIRDTDKGTFGISFCESVDEPECISYGEPIDESQCADHDADRVPDPQPVAISDREPKRVALRVADETNDLADPLAVAISEHIAQHESKR